MTGFTLLIRRTGEADRPLVAYRGTAAPPGGDSHRYLVDPGRKLERLLLDAGRRVLTPGKVGAVGADPSSPR